MGQPTLLEQALQAERDQRYSDAYRTFLDCLRLPQHDTGDISFHLGWCLEQDKESDKEEVLAHYRRAVDLASGPACRANAMFRMGWILMHERHYPGAEEMFLKAAEYCETVGLRVGVHDHALYWYAVCLESRGCYLEALKWYDSVRRVSAQLDPESRFRQIVCLNQIGAYDNALKVCMTFDQPSPAGFDETRYRQLRQSADVERMMLQTLLATNGTAR